MILVAGTSALLLHTGLVASLLLGAILASTDPVVLRDVLRDARIPRSVRPTLSVEAGTNDLVVLPTVLVLIALARAGLGSVPEWLAFLGELFILGPLVGLAAGCAGAWLMAQADARFSIRRCTVSGSCSRPTRRGRPSAAAASWSPLPPGSPSIELRAVRLLHGVRVKSKSGGRASMSHSARSTAAPYWRNASAIRFQPRPRSTFSRA